MTDQGRGGFAPRKQWANESDDEEDKEPDTKQEEEEDMMPRKNREAPEERGGFKAKFVPRENHPQERGKTDDYKFKKDPRRDRNQVERNPNKQRQYNGDRSTRLGKEVGRDHEKPDNRPDNRDKKGDKDNFENRNNRGNRYNQNQRDNRNHKQDNRDGQTSKQEYRIQQLSRRPLPKYTNTIDIKANDIKGYVKQASEMLGKFDFITIRGVRTRIGQAFSVAEQVCKTVKNLDRINIPATDRIEETHIPLVSGLVQRRKTRYIPMIIIELSKKQLNHKHIGHQSYKDVEENNDYKRPVKRAKRTYQQKGTSLEKPNVTPDKAVLTDEKPVQAL